MKSQPICEEVQQKLAKIQEKIEKTQAVWWKTQKILLNCQWIHLLRLPELWWNKKSDLDMLILLKNKILRF